MTNHTNITIRRLLESSDANLRRAESAVSASPEDIDAWKALFSAAKRAGKVLVINFSPRWQGEPVTGVYEGGQGSDKGWERQGYLETRHGRGKISLKYYVRGLTSSDELFLIRDRV
jgi:hypothetical protein